MADAGDGSATTGFRAGDRIFHPRLGNGTVLRLGRGILSVRLDSGSDSDFLENYPGVRRLTATEEGRISPTWPEIHDPERFVPPLTAGERELAEYLDRNLPDGWRIYVRPHLDADRPLLAAVHPEAGGMFWDVVGWDLSRFRVEQGVWLTDSRRFSSPYQFMNAVRSRLYGVYVPEIGEALNAERRVYAVIRAALYFPKATTAEAARMATLDPAAEGIWALGHDALTDGNLGQIVPILHRAGQLQPTWFEQLDQALTHNRQLPDALTAIDLTAEQRRRAQPKPGYSAIEGVAGSGKTVVLAYRAGAAADAGRRVLILTFNRTLTNYIRGVMRLVPFTYRRDRVTVMHFHGLCRRIHDHHEVPLPSGYRTGDNQSGRQPGEDDVDSHLLNVQWPASAEEIIKTLGVPPALRFDVVLVDEGQDFTPEWLQLIGHLGASEVVMALDAAQRLYDREDAMSRKEIAALFGGTAGRAKPLGQAVRLPGPTVRLAAAFAERWSLPVGSIEPADDGLLVPDATIEAFPAETPAAAAACVIGVLRSWQAEPEYRARDVAVVVSEKAFGGALVLHLAELGTATNHVFAVANTGALLDEGGDEGRVPWKIAQAKKTAFAYGDSRLKVSTVHSFKGWEASRVILVLPFERPSQQSAGTVYVGLTRSRGKLVLVGRVDDYGLGGLPAPAGVRDTADPKIALRFRALLANAERVGRGSSGQHHPRPGSDVNLRWDDPMGWADD